LIDVLRDHVGIVVFPVRVFRRREGSRHARSGHEDPFAELAVVGDLQLTAEESLFVEHLRLEWFGDVDHVALLEDEAP